MSRPIKSSSSSCRKRLVPTALFLACCVTHVDAAAILAHKSWLPTNHRSLEDYNNNQRDNNSKDNNQEDRAENGNNKNYNYHHYQNQNYHYSYRRSYKRDPYYEADSTGARGYSSRQRHNYANYYTHISDVLACLAMALGWAVWMLSSFAKNSETELRTKYATESMIVRAHVRQVSVHDSELGFPVYRAVIDYMVPSCSISRNPAVSGTLGAESMENAKLWASAVNCPALMTDNSNVSNDDYANDSHVNSNKNRVHIRKQFETQQPLEEGFANIELLVLPQEPTHSVLRDDYEKELEEQQQYMDDEWCWKAAKCRRLSMIFSGSLILGSIAGAIHVVEHLAPTHQVWGWVTVCLGASLLLPGALFIQWLLTAFQDALDFGSEKQGIIIDDKTAQGPYSPSCGGLTDARDGADDADLGADIPETAGCYFIRLPQVRNRMPGIPKGCGNGILAQHALGNRTGSERSGSVSSISSTSIHERLSHSGVSV